MLQRFQFFVLSFLLLVIGAVHGQSTSIENLCLDEQEMKLVELINRFRVENKQLPIGLSRSLSFVAKSHVNDLQMNKQDTSICNAHSWSNKGKWKACCFNNYVNSNDCMWDKPKELTPYNFRGYEMVYSEEGIVDVDSVFRLWRTTEEASDMLLTKNLHSDKKWLAMGVGVSENYVSIWFGQRTDPTDKLLSCAQLVKVSSTQQAENAIEQTIELSTKTARYFIIYGSFNSQADANEAVKRYKKSGITNVSILQKEDRFRVAIDVYDNLKEAMNAKVKLQNLYPEAWIYKE